MTIDKNKTLAEISRDPSVAQAATSVTTEERNAIFHNAFWLLFSQRLKVDSFHPENFKVGDVVKVCEFIDSANLVVGSYLSTTQSGTSSSSSMSQHRKTG